MAHNDMNAITIYIYINDTSTNFTLFYELFSHVNTQPTKYCKARTMPNWPGNLQNTLIESMLRRMT